jgi:Mn-dependent DtxR family transcriptional regulator
VSEPLLASGALREAHAFARENGYVTQVRRGTYFLTAQGRELVRRNGLHKQLDNLRMFLMKDQRRKYR